jgi:protoheme IX farnesyltransferase
MSVTAPVVAAPEAPVRVPGVAERYLLLTKPGIIALLLVTTLGGMLATGQLPGWGLAIATLVAGGLCAASATTLNSWLDWDIDQLMARTQRRPLPRGLVSRPAALLFGLGLGALSMVVFLVWVNPLSALLGLVALAYYVVIYSRVLKKTTYHNVVIGGAAGAFPPLIGWTAVTNSIDPGAVFLFLIVFFWTPPHAWALTLLMKDDYRKAGVPMMPVVLGEHETYRQISLYTVSLVAITIIPATLGLFGSVYLVAALLLGGIHLGYALLLQVRPTGKRELGLYRYSSLYLALLMLALVADRTLFAG